MKLYEIGKQYNKKADLWETIKTTMSDVKLAEVIKITNSMDNKFMAVIKKVGWFNGISTFVGYLMSKPSFKKNSMGTI